MTRPIGISRTMLAVTAAVAGAALLGAGRTAAAGPQRFTFYADAKNERFINNVDDLSRGEGHNPFGNVSAAKPPTNEKVSGPLTGDEAMFAFDLYTGSDRKTSAGNVIFVCWYNFNQNALCNAAFQLNGGTLVGKGAFNFNDAKFTIVLTGGTSKYRSMGGDVQVTALGPGTQAQPVYRAVPMLQAQRLDFVIQHA